MHGWEDCAVDVWGPRTGKTTTRVVPAVLEAPGAVVVTSNKADVVDATIGPRAERGPVTVFDPQGVVSDQAPGFWFDPLAYVTDEARAAELADVFAAAARDRDARPDAFFDVKAQKVIAALLLATAKDGRTIDHAYHWVTDPREVEPVELLRRHGHDLMARSLESEIAAPEKQRGGIFGTAEKSLAFLTSRDTLAWVTPGPGRVRLDVHELVRGTGTLYSLSKEGKGNAGALVAALTVSVTDAAEQLARQSGGRLQTPLVVALDEAANVCRWAELPNLYSHFGSRGIVLLTFLQSWSQGAEVWGRDGMRKLWSAATVKVVGPGVDEVAFLEDVSRLIGDYDRATTSASYGRGHQGRGRDSRSISTQRDRILSVADLSAMPRGRGVVLAAGAHPVLTKFTPWWAR